MTARLLIKRTPPCTNRKIQSYFHFIIPSQKTFTPIGHTKKQLFFDHCSLQWQCVHPRKIVMNNTENAPFADNSENILEGNLYKLDGKKPVPCSFEEYITFMKSATHRIIEQTQIGDWLISTVFTGMDHAFGQGEKRLFETTVFGLPNDTRPCWYFSTWNQAIRKHRKLAVMLESNGVESLMEDIRKRQE